MPHPASDVPEVTVITGAYNAMPYVTRSVESVAEQTLGRDRIEHILIDDGSTDGTGAELDRLATEYGSGMKVIHQANSGGPGGPRNVGLEHARGRFVFFLDADDYLGPEALERMVAAAEDNGSDVVLGKMVGEGGRRPPKSMFKRNQPRTDVFRSRVYWTLNPMKLFRRELIERRSLRFRSDLSTGEDQPFVAEAYLNAAAISVIADYDCVHWVTRSDGGNVTKSNRGTQKRLKFLSVMLGLISDNVPPGPRRDHLLHRHFSVEVPNALTHLRRETNREEQERAFVRLRELVTASYGKGLAGLLRPFQRLIVDVIMYGSLDDVLETGRLRNAKRGHVGKGSASWAPDDPSTLLFEFQCALPGAGGGAPHVEMTNDAGMTFAFTAEPQPGGAASDMHLARVPLTRLAAEHVASATSWTVAVGVRLGDYPGRAVLPVKPSVGLTSWQHHGRPWRAEPLPGGAIRLQPGKASFLLSAARSARRVLVRGLS